jgi:hypothetical protein
MIYMLGFTQGRFHTKEMSRKSPGTKRALSKDSPPSSLHLPNFTRCFLKFKCLPCFITYKNGEPFISKKDSKKRDKQIQIEIEIVTFLDLPWIKC